MRGLLPLAQGSTRWYLGISIAFRPSAQHRASSGQLRCRLVPAAVLRRVHTMNRAETKLDRVVQRMKDHRFVMWFLLGGLALIGLGHISDALAKVAAIAQLIGVSSPSSSNRSANARRQIEKAQIPFSRKHFMKAISDGEYDTVQLFLAAGMDPNVALQDSRTALLIATAKGHADLVRLLLEAGAEVDKPGEFGLTPLMLAANNGDEDILRLLISHGASVTRRDKEGLPPLMWAVMACSRPAVEILLQAQADANPRDEDGATALMYAVEVCDKPEKEDELNNIIMSLVARGADLEAKDDNGETVLDHARGQGIEGLLATLAERKRKS